MAAASTLDSEHPAASQIHQLEQATHALNWAGGRFSPAALPTRLPQQISSWTSSKQNQHQQHARRTGRIPALPISQQLPSFRGPLCGHLGRALGRPPTDPGTVACRYGAQKFPR